MCSWNSRVVSFVTDILIVLVAGIGWYTGFVVLALSFAPVWLSLGLPSIVMGIVARGMLFRQRWALWSGIVLLGVALPGSIWRAKLWFDPRYSDDMRSTLTSLWGTDPVTAVWWFGVNLLWSVLPLLGVLFLIHPRVRARFHGKR